METQREKAQWLLDHPQYSDAMVAEWTVAHYGWPVADLGAEIELVRNLRQWAKNGFKDYPWPD